jgi:ribosomal protein S18 acetylase RimI-like enzyme
MTASSHPPAPATTKQPAGYTIRPAHMGDIAGIAQLGAAVFAATFGHSVTPAELSDYLASTYTEEIIKQDLQDATRDVIVATTTTTDDDEAEPGGGGLLGFAYLARGTTEPCVADVPDLAELQRLYVGTAAQGRGVGAALAREVDARARAQGFRHLWLGVWEENEKAIRAYVRWGYRRVGEHHFDVGSNRQTDHVMLKDL